MSASVVGSANAAESPWPGSTSRGGTTSIGHGIAISVAAHALALLGVVLAARGQPHPVTPTVYRVALVAAPAGPTPAASVGAFPQRSPATSESRAPNASSAAAPPPPAAPAKRSVAAPKPATPSFAAHRVPPAVAKAVPSATRLSSREAAEPVHHGSTPNRFPSPAAPLKSTPLGKVATRGAAPATTVHAAPPAAAVPAANAGAAPAAKVPAGSSALGKRVPPKHPSEHVSERGSGSAPPASQGRDVADVRVVGLAFPFPGYLDNLVRQVRLRFAPTQTRAGLHADLSFVVARDGSIGGLRVVRSSGSYAFDLEAQGAVEAAGSAHAFGPLPDGFHPPALPVTFSFDPRLTP